MTNEAKEVKVVPQMDENTVVLSEGASDISPLAIINRAVQQGTDVEVLERMFDLYERNEKREAQKAFDKAMAAFQGEAPRIKKSKKADRYYYAPLEEILKMIQPVLTKHGLSVRFDTKMGEGNITAFCTVAHEAGHKETSEFTCPIDRENKTKINVSQLQGSANSYAKRYALGNALNLAYCDEDDDGQAAGTEYLTEKEQANIEALLTETNADRKLFLQWASGAESIAEIPRNWYKACVRELERKRRQG